MKQIKVSIIIPIYKVPEKYLKKCIESCINQTLKEIEIILVDDGSPDNCGKICDEYAGKDERIKVIHKENFGLSAARNTGFFVATGKWITFVDGDDWIDSEMCKEMYLLGEKNRTQIVICGISKEYEHKSIRYKYYLDEYRIYKKDECKNLQKQLLIYNANMGAAYSKLIDKEILLKNNILHDEFLKQGAEGLDFMLRLFEKIESAIFINKPFYHYIYNSNSISASHDEKNHKYVIKCFEKIKKFIEKSENKEQLLSWFYNRLLYVIITTAISGYFNPDNTEKYGIKKEKYKTYLQQSIIKEALEVNMIKGLSIQRRITLWLIKHKLFFIVNIMGYIRKWQKNR